MRGHRRNSEAGRLKCVSLLSVLYLRVKATGLLGDVDLINSRVVNMR